MTLSGVIAHAQIPAERTFDAAQFLGPDFMQSPYHRVEPRAVADGYMLRYAIETPYEQIIIIGTEQAKLRILEIHATETLRQRSTGGAILGSAKDRTTNLVKTPYRIGKTLVNRAGDISNVEEAVLFVPEQVGQATGSLLNGVGELGVTALRITKGAAGTKCSGFGCVEKQAKISGPALIHWSANIMPRAASMLNLARTYKQIIKLTANKLIVWLCQ